MSVRWKSRTASYLSTACFQSERLLLSPICFLCARRILMGLGVVATEMRGGPIRSKISSTKRKMTTFFRSENKYQDTCGEARTETREEAPNDGSDRSTLPMQEGVRYAAELSPLPKVPSKSRVQESFRGVTPGSKGRSFRRGFPPFQDTSSLQTGRCICGRSSTPKNIHCGDFCPLEGEIPSRRGHFIPQEVW